MGAAESEPETAGLGTDGRDCARLSLLQIPAVRFGARGGAKNSVRKFASWFRGFPQDQIRSSSPYQEIWKRPIYQVAKDHGIFDVGLSKVCRRLGVPTPPVGYWAK